MSDYVDPIADFIQSSALKRYFRKMKKPLCDETNAICDNWRYNGNTYSIIKGYISERYNPRTVLELNGGKRIIFKNIVFKERDQVCFYMQSKQLYDVYNEYDTAQYYTPAIIEFENCSGVVQFFGNNYFPIIYVHSDKEDELTMSFRNCGTIIDFLRVGGNATAHMMVYNEDGIKSNIGVLCNAVRIEKEAAIYTLTNFHVKALVNTGVLKYVGEPEGLFGISTRYGNSNCNIWFGPCQIDIDDVRGKDDLDYKTIIKMLDAVKNRELEYMCDKYTIGQYLDGKAREGEIMPDFSMTYNVYKQLIKEDYPYLLSYGDPFTTGNSPMHIIE